MAESMFFVGPPLTVIASKLSKRYRLVYRALTLFSLYLEYFNRRKSFILRMNTVIFYSISKCYIIAEFKPFMYVRLFKCIISEKLFKFVIMQTCFNIIASFKVSGLFSQFDTSWTEPNTRELSWLQ